MHCPIEWTLRTHELALSVRWLSATSGDATYEKTNALGGAASGTRQLQPWPSVPPAEVSSAEASSVGTSGEGDGLQARPAPGAAIEEPRHAALEAGKNPQWLTVSREWLGLIITIASPSPSPWQSRLSS